ncbi:MAG TPA: ABC-type transport auxiliary lipoprotein family protein [Burkholderiaceae bacterium]|nr:ABC-type transport auxiliary lipoprotein family protein [Burkholderiaceae bacterium]
MLVRLLAAAAATALASGCVSLTVGKDTPVQSQFRIVDRGAPPAPAARPIGRELVIAPQPGASVDDSFALAYSRAAQQRAAYQFASWSDRPSSRLAQLLVDRLTARNAFTSVALVGRGVAGNLQLNLTVNDFFHDASSDPGTARVEVSAELIDRTTRRLLGRKVFNATAPVERADSAAAAAALSAASSTVLDQLTAWVEATAAPSALALRH